MDRYADFCGPGALAAALGITRETAAAQLRYVRNRDGWQNIEPSTLASVLATALADSGYSVESWSTEVGTWKREPFVIGEPWIVEGVRRRRVECVHQPASSPDPEHEAIRRRRAGIRRPYRFSVGEWIERRPVGLWLLFTDLHVFAARSGRISAGEEGGSLSTPLSLAWRVLPKTVSARKTA